MKFKNVKKEVKEPMAGYSSNNNNKGQGQIHRQVQSTKGNTGNNLNAGKSVNTELGNSKKLKIITLSGTVSVTKNMTLYEYDDAMIAVDCGIGFPDSEMLGVDVVIPDMSYIMDNSHKFKGLFITHAHEDHIGAIPYFLKEFNNAHIYCNKLVEGLVRERLKEKRFKGLDQGVSFHTIDDTTPEVDLGSFKISAFSVNHSVPRSQGFAIKTPEGTVLHMADYKIDWTPVLDEPIDLGTIANYGKEGVLCLLTDCLNVTTEGYSKSEATLNRTFDDLFEDAEGRQIFVTTISSNISRMYQIIQAAISHGRKVVLSGRSIDTTVRVARGLGYLPFDEDVFIKEEVASSTPQKDLVYIIAGCYGQQGSSLDRLARGEHESIVVEEEALVVFSADPNPPGVAEAVERVMDELTLKGAQVIYSKIQDNLHVSGHGPKGDLVTIAKLVKPKYFIPIGGTITKAHAYANMVQDLGFDKKNVFSLLEGEVVEFSNGEAKMGQRLTLEQVLVDGKGIGEMKPIVMKDREQLSSDGVFVVVVPMSNNSVLSNKVEIVTRGFIYVKESQELMGKSKDLVTRALNKKAEGSEEWGSVKRSIESDVQRFLYKQTGRNPMVIVHSINI